MDSEPLTIDGFLRKYKTKNGDVITHTRIGCVEKGIYGGSFSIPNDSMDHFWKLYHKEVIKGGSDSYLTEVQLNDSGPILIDIDERYSNDVTERQHQHEHIEDIIGLYIEKLKELVVIEEDLRFQCFILEKDSINTKDENYVKDGIHIVITINIPHIVQLALRSMVLEEIDSICSDLPLINTYQDFIDISIPRGKTNWQVLGSKKPGQECYKITSIINVKIDAEGEEEYDNEDIVDVNEDLLKKISARNDNNIKLPLSDIAKEHIEKSNKKIKVKRKGKITINRNKFETINDCLLVFPRINSPQLCDAVIKKITECAMEDDEYDIKHAFELTELLDQSYYGPGSYDKWTKVAWALKSISKYLYPAFLKMSSKSTDFVWAQNDCFEFWNKPYSRDLTIGSLKYWAKECNPEEYKKINDSSVDFYVRKSLAGETEFDVAKLVHNIYEGQYACVNIRSKTWFEYLNGRWNNIDSGTTLRQALSLKISVLYQISMKKLLNTFSGNKMKEEDEQASRKQALIMSKMAEKLKKTTWKQNIMRECCEVFYDSKFLDMLDTHKHLLCFKNGVLDMKEKVFRDGRPDDYLSLCTNTTYTPYDPNDLDQVRIRKEITTFMKQLFPIPNVCQYMWEHLASTLNGDNVNQTFNIYLGSGRNGKSILVNLMGHVLGDYKGSVPLTIITQKRTNIGTASPEIAQLQGVRYAVMQEPSKNTRLNEGPFKELVGNDPLQGRALFQDTVTFIPQFKLAVCTNHLFDIKSNDDGTWRRIRIVDFISKFVDNPSDDTNDHEYQIDRRLEEKFKTWVPVFTAMLVEIIFKTDGRVIDCDEVLASSQKYKEQQDHFAGFLKERIRKHETGLLKKSDVNEEFQEWFSELYGGKVPSGRELYEYLEKKLGRPTRRGWKGYTLCHDYDLVDDDDIAPNDISGN